VSAEFYQYRELNLVLDYFERKGRGDLSIPVPSLSVFAHVTESKHASLALATFAERELRAIYMGIGRPVSQSQAAEFTECWESGQAAATSDEISQVESEIESALERVDELREQLADLKARGVEADSYLPEDLFPVIEQLQREGA